jgi:gibberellin 2beta-dioxygenase
MVVLVPSTTTPVRQETTTTMAPPPHAGDGIPTVDMSAPLGRAALSRQVARACAEQGFFRATNHGVPPGTSARLDAATAAFFALPLLDKQRAGPPSPLGYGCRNIGYNGDAGELEYLLLHASPAAVAHRARSIDADDPSRFRYTLSSCTCTMHAYNCASLLHILLKICVIHTSGLMASEEYIYGRGLCLNTTIIMVKRLDKCILSL